MSRNTRISVLHHLNRNLADIDTHIPDFVRVQVSRQKNGALSLVKSCFLTKSQGSIFPLVKVTQHSLCSRSPAPYLVHTPALRLLSPALELPVQPHCKLFMFRNVV